MEIGNIVWDIVLNWGYFEKKPLGPQIVRAADSIALNIAEGYGRFHYKENKNFCYFSRGSAKETLVACRKARTRNLINEERFMQLNEKLDSYFRLSFRYIQTIGNKDEPPDE